MSIAHFFICENGKTNSRATTMWEELRKIYLLKYLNLQVVALKWTRLELRHSCHLAATRGTTTIWTLKIF